MQKILSENAAISKKLGTACHHGVHPRSAQPGGDGQDTAFHRPSFRRQADHRRRAGSSARDYESVGIPFDERWKRLDDAVLTMRSLMTADGTDHTGDYYSTVGISLEPLPAQRPAPPIWIGSWGADVGLKRTARIGDGWLASAYNTTQKD